MMQGIGSYSLQNLSVWSQAEVRAEISRFANEVAGANTDVNSHRNALIAAGANGTRFWNDWQVFLRDWAAYQARITAQGPALFATNSTSTISDLRMLADRYNALEPRFRDLTGVAASNRSGDSRASGFSLPFSETLGTGGSIALMAGSALGVTALVALAVLATQARALVMRNPRRRKRR